MKRVSLSLSAAIVLSIAFISLHMNAASPLDRDFNNQVKSVAEMLARFNGIEAKPGVVGRRANLLALFDYDMEKRIPGDSLKVLVDDFVSTVEEWHGELRLSDACAWAEATCIFTFNKAEVTLSLILQQETFDEDRRRWAVAGVRGLSKAGFYDETRVTISPVDHELHFMSFNDLMNHDHRLASAMRAISRDIDELSFFLALVQSGTLKFNRVDDLKFHFTDVPNYVFTIEDISRPGNNSGWLITSLIRVTEREKQHYINQLYGYKDED